MLRILADLPQAATMGQAAAACSMSERTLKRKLMTVRLALGIPANGLTRYRPGDLAELLWTALAVSPTDRQAAPILVLGIGRARSWDVPGAARDWPASVAWSPLDLYEWCCMIPKTGTLKTGV